MAHQQLSPPSAFIEHWLHNLRPADGEGATMLDLACGTGRHGRRFLSAGWQVTFVDINTDGVDGLAGNSGVTIIEADLEGEGGWPLKGLQFDVVVVCNYLWRPNWQRLLQLVKPGGHLLYETFAEGNEAYGKPSNPNFLLKSGELLDVTSGKFEVLDYRHGLQEKPTPAIKQKIAARRLLSDES